MGLNHSCLLLAITPLLMACSTAPSPLEPAYTSLTPRATSSSFAAMPDATEAIPATLVTPDRTVAPANTPVPVPLATTTASSLTATAVPAATIPPAAPGLTVTIKMENYRFFPPILRVRAGETVRFNLQNPDIISHAIAIRDARFSAVLRPGTRQVVDFVVDLPPGSYDVVCPVQEEGNHEELGMVGTLIVEAAPR